MMEGFSYLEFYYKDDPKENHKREALGCFEFGDMVPVWDDMAVKLDVDMQPTEEEAEIIRKEKQEKTYRLEMTEDGEVVIKPNFE